MVLFVLSVYIYIYIYIFAFLNSCRPSCSTLSGPNNIGRTNTWGLHDSVTWCPTYTGNDKKGITGVVSNCPH